MNFLLVFGLWAAMLFLVAAMISAALSLMVNDRPCAYRNTWQNRLRFSLRDIFLL